MPEFVLDRRSLLSCGVGAASAGVMLGSSLAAARNATDVMSGSVDTAAARAVDRVRFPGPRPVWLTLDCYGSLIQLDEGLLAAVQRLLKKRSAESLDAATVLEVFDFHEYNLELLKPHMSFRKVGTEALRRTFAQLQLPFNESDVDELFASFSTAPPFPDVVPALQALTGC